MIARPPELRQSEPPPHGAPQTVVRGPLTAQAERLILWAAWDGSAVVPSAVRNSPLE